MSVSVTDNGVPALSVTSTFTVTVNAAVPSPVIESISVSNGVATITWNTSVAHTYRLQYKDNLDNLGNTNWTDLLPDVRVSGATATVYNSVGNSTQRFYRVIVVQ